MQNKRLIHSIPQQYETSSPCSVFAFILLDPEQWQSLKSSRNRKVFFIFYFYYKHVFLQILLNILCYLRTQKGVVLKGETHAMLVLGDGSGPDLRPQKEDVGEKERGQCRVLFRPAWPIQLQYQLGNLGQVTEHFFITCKPRVKILALWCCWELEISVKCLTLRRHHSDGIGSVPKRQLQYVWQGKL